MESSDPQKADDAPVKVGTRYRCNGCGSEVVVVRAAAGPVTCCDRPMERM